jgi:short-subunit dehydrogenase
MDGIITGPMAGQTALVTGGTAGIGRAPVVMGFAL